MDDARLAAAAKMFVQDVRDWLETLEGKDLVECSLGTEGISAYITAKGRQALRLQFIRLSDLRSTSDEAIRSTLATPPVRTILVLAANPKGTGPSSARRGGQKDRARARTLEAT